MFVRTLRSIGRHPVAGAWVLAQSVVLFWIAYWTTYEARRAAELLWPTLFLHGLAPVLQLPASLLTLPAMNLATRWIDVDARTASSLFLWQSVVAGTANSLLAYAGPTIADYVESRWPFERGHRRRLQALHGQKNVANS